METELFTTKYSKEESEFLNGYSKYLCSEIEKGLTQEELLDILKLAFIQSKSYSTAFKNCEGLREIVNALESAMGGEDKTGKATYKTKEHIAYNVAGAILKAKGKHYYYLDILMKMVGILHIEKEVEIQKDFIHLRNTNYPEFAKKHCPEMISFSVQGVDEQLAKIKAESICPIILCEKDSKGEIKEVKEIKPSPPKPTKRKLFDFTDEEEEEDEDGDEVELNKSEKPKAKRERYVPDEKQPISYFEGEIKKEQDRLAELEKQDETGWDDFELSIKGKKINMGLVKNHIIYYQRKIAERKGVPYVPDERYESDNDKEDRAERIKEVNLQGYIQNGDNYIYWTHYGKKENNISQIESVLEYDKNRSYGVIVYDIEKNEYSNTWIITNDFAKHLLKTYLMEKVPEKTSIPSWANPKFAGTRKEFETIEVTEKCFNDELREEWNKKALEERKGKGQITLFTENKIERG
jgi:hypothetical protein